jgi:hypothetical protein
MANCVAAKPTQGLNCQIIHHFLPNSAPKNLPFNLPRDRYRNSGEFYSVDYVEAWRLVVEKQHDAIGDIVSKYFLTAPPAPEKLFTEVWAQAFSL